MLRVRRSVVHDCMARYGIVRPAPLSLGRPKQNALTEDKIVRLIGMLRGGYSYAYIADDLRVSPRSVKEHVSRLRKAGHLPDKAVLDQARAKMSAAERAMKVSQAGGRLPFNYNKPGRVHYATVRERQNNPRNMRPPLPAGHPISWGAITVGTVLEDSQFEPLPPGR